MSDYYTKALAARDPRYKLVLDRLGYGTRRMMASAAEAEVMPEETEEEDSGPTLDELREAAEALGIDVDNRWREARLTKEIEAAKAKG